MNATARRRDDDGESRNERGPDADRAVLDYSERACGFGDMGGCTLAGLMLDAGAKGGVAMTPGAIALHRTPMGPRSTAIAAVRPCTPPFDAE